MTAPYTTTGWGRVPLPPAPEDLEIEEMIVAICLIYRCAGNSTVSVAEHSINVWGRVQSEGRCVRTQFHALIHDLHEAVIGDITRPVARHLGMTRELARLKVRTDRAIYERLGIDYPVQYMRNDVIAADEWAWQQERGWMEQHPGLMLYSVRNPCWVRNKFVDVYSRLKNEILDRQRAKALQALWKNDNG